MTWAVALLSGARFCESLSEKGHEKNEIVSNVNRPPKWMFYINSIAQHQSATGCRSIGHKDLDTISWCMFCFSFIHKWTTHFTENMHRRFTVIYRLENRSWTKLTHQFHIFESIILKDCSSNFTIYRDA